MLHRMDANVATMSLKPTPITPALYDYLLDATLREPEPLRRLRAETAVLPAANMQIAPEQGQLLALLVRLIGARTALEIGVFTGYSALCVALALPPDGRLVACDISEEYTRVARRYWEDCGVAKKIDLHLGRAMRTLDGLLASGAAGRFDFAFIDADKSGYDGYYERSLQLVRTGGLIVFDNMLWDGRVADPEAHDADTEAIRALNLKLRDDPRIELSLLTVADGVSLAMKR